MPARRSARLFALGAVVMALAVALGAFGAHGLKSHTDAAGLATWETAVRYQAWHGLALLALALAGELMSARGQKAAAWCFGVGVLIFSGSLYILVLSGLKWLGAITPIGGVAMIAGWLVVCVSAWLRKFEP